MAIDPNEIEMTFLRSGGPGGQHRNVTETAVRVRHIPTGIVVVAKGERSQMRNRMAALEELERRLAARNRRRKKRHATKPTRGAVQRRLEGKKKQGEKKQTRKRVDPD